MNVLTSFVNLPGLLLWPSARGLKLQLINSAAQVFVGLVSDKL
jgi:hypothetical protein